MVRAAVVLWVVALITSTVLLGVVVAVQSALLALRARRRTPSAAPVRIPVQPLPGRAEQRSVG